MWTRVVYSEIFIEILESLTKYKPQVSKLKISIYEYKNHVNIDIKNLTNL